MSPSVSDGYTPPLVTSSFSAGGSMAPSATSVTSGANAPATNAGVAQAIQQNQQNTQDAQSSPIGISPNNVGTIGSKIFNGGFSNQVSALNQFGADQFGLARGGQTAAQAAQQGFGSSFTPAANTVSQGFGADATTLDQGFGDLATGDAATSGAAGAASLSGIMGAGALGALGGGFLAGALGENKLGGSIGGGVGAAAGMAFGGAGAAALGLELGSFAGPVGALVGGIGGAVFGGMFGNKKPATQASESTFGMAPNGSINGQSFGDKNSQGHTGYAGQLDSSLSNIYSSASKDLGINFKQAKFRAGYNSLYGGPGGGFIQANGKSYNFDPSNDGQKNQAIYNALADSAKASGYTDTDTLKTWYSTATTKAADTKNGVFQMPATPTISTSASTFADYMNKTKGTA